MTNSHDIDDARAESAQARRRPQERKDMTETRQEYIDNMVRTRGYVLDYHKYMAKADYDVLQASNGLIEAAYLRDRLLDRRTKELLFILSLTVMRASKEHIASHIRVALSIGLSPQEILEAIEIALPEAGVVAFQVGFEAWWETVDAEGLEPTPGLLDGREPARDGV